MIDAVSSVFWVPVRAVFSLICVGGRGHRPGSGVAAEGYRGHQGSQQFFWIGLVLAAKVCGF